MSRHPSTEAFQMDLRTSPSQQQLNPSRSSSLSQQDEMDQQQNEKSHKLDLYSVPVFLLEVLVLIGLGYCAQYVHFQQHQVDPLTTGFYCDDASYRQQSIETAITRTFSQKPNELTVVALLLAVPIVLILFCELVNSMFGSLKFRQIRALCTCCKLHSITRRSIRFSGAYLLGLLIVMISCDILALSAGRLRPYFAQECPSAYRQCAATVAGSGSLGASQSRGRELTSLLPSTMAPSTSAAATSAAVLSESILNGASSITTVTPTTAAASNLTIVQSSSGASRAPGQIVAPIGTGAAPQAAALMMQANTSPPTLSGSSRIRQATGASSIIIAERQWIDLTGLDLGQVCQFNAGDRTDEELYLFKQLATSWPSFPAAIVTYACLFVACYLSFVGTARPFRIITCVLVMVLLLLATMFNVLLVKEHYNHWDDAVAGAVLAFVVVVFILMVYLNKFRDSHYYENQKLYSKSKVLASDSFRAYSGDSNAAARYSFDKTNGVTNPSVVVPNGTNDGVNNSNDLAMRYFQIPRANYRGAPRPLSSLNQMN